MRTTLVQNARITFSDMQIKGSHLEFYLDIVVIFQIYYQKMNSSSQYTLESGAPDELYVQIAVPSSFQPGWQISQLAD